MNTTDAKAAIQEITNSCLGIKIFFVDKSNQIYDSDVDDELLADFRSEFVESLTRSYSNNESFTCPALSQEDGRNHALYHFDFNNDEPFEFSFLDKVNSLRADEPLATYPARDAGLGNLRGYIVRLRNADGKLMSFFQYIHHSYLATPGKTIFLTTHESRVVKLSHDVLRLGNRFVFAKVGDDYLIENVGVLEKEFGFDKIIRSKAAQYCTTIEEKALVTDLTKFKDQLTNDTSFARKLVKVCKGSAVIEKGISNETIIKFAMSKTFYQEKLKLSKDGSQFDLSSINRCRNFLTLLDDEFVKSELTQQEYISKTKDRAS
ncbi:anti-phage protein KwaB [Vibrio splendidus]|uniref:Anti-phage protein KwaB n=1 Tax=Vibrio splendidus TaxID=29497 RepID=A0ABD5AD22_VIBSP|nr:anti-phage protein KwaB [Vibrio splendidus]MDP2491128.1 anti-phage protein KwaB [Vibrio splendidus]PMO48177.1 hypothetical protein BCT08_07920 [Vibrio splendidus]